MEKNRSTSPASLTRAGLNAIAPLKRARLALPLCALLLAGCSYDYGRPADYGGYDSYGYYRGYGYYPGPYGYYGPYYPYSPWFGLGFVRPLPHDHDHDHDRRRPPPPPAAAPPSSSGQPSARSLEPSLRGVQPPPRVERPRPPQRPSVGRSESIQRQQLDRMRSRSSGARPGGGPRRFLDQD